MYIVLVAISPEMVVSRPYVNEYDDVVVGYAEVEMFVMMQSTRG